MFLSILIFGSHGYVTKDVLQSTESVALLVDSIKAMLLLVADGLRPRNSAHL
jgi:hypothetical protein